MAAVERKGLADLVTSLTTGKLKYQLADPSSLPRAALVVEERYSAVFRLPHVRPAVVADGLAECQVTWPNVPIVFCETRPLAQEWTYRFLAAHRPPSRRNAAWGTRSPTAGACPPAHGGGHARATR